MKKYSKLAKEIKNFLEDEILPNYDVTLVEEYNAGNGMRYDFCFPYLKTMIAIEADGVQHEKYVPFFHRNEQGFEESKYRDFHKNFNTAMKGGVIIRINQKNFPNVRKILEEELLKNNLEILLQGDIKKCNKKRKK